MVVRPLDTTMSEAITSVIIASASAVAKVFVIGAIGYVSAIRPKAAPILPASAMNAISKMNFNLLIIPLVYSALASGVTPSALGSLWIVLVSGIGVICLSYAVASLLGKLPFFRVDDRTDFDALRIAAAFPNIVALPILIFPTLCEFPVVYNAFYEGGNESTDGEKYKSCVDESNAMIFVYFFAWNLLYWIIGYPTLVAAGKKRQMKNDATLSATEPHNPPSDNTFDNEELQVKIDVEGDNQERQSNNSSAASVPKGIDENVVPDEDTKDGSEARKRFKGLITLVTNAIIQTLKSPGFVAMVLGVITACIPPLRDALFSTGGPLRFLGSALESLGRAGASVGTLVVAASLVHQANAVENSPAQGADTEVGALNVSTSNNEHSSSGTSLRESMRRRRSSLSQLSIRVMDAIKKRKPTLRMHFWFCISRLIVTPAIVCLLIIAGDCGGILNGFPSLAKLVVIVNSCLPGAQLIVLTLKSRGLSESASIVAQVYLPSYLFSVVTIAAWTSLGLIISTPNEDGSSFCNR
ncbi:putative auxin efflux carrier [Skeletonema marinoi]|uniref:Auxin efflux carrier n=1 Tax=Skeletonema marinoi TaxID=267567 RepID=A0AAD8Y6U2_9STRA|nr:putative auxin efflux carrier [Skeletonema marinoi]